MVLLVAACGDDGATVHDAQVDTAAGDAAPDMPAGPTWVKEYDNVTDNVALEAIWGSGPNDVYVVGAKGNACLVLHSTGDGTWTEQTSGVSTVNGGLYTVWGSGSGDIYVGGFSDTLLHSTGDGSWSPQTIGNLGPFNIWGSGPTDVYFAYAASGGNVYHSTGDGTWTPLMIGSASSTISAVWGTDSSNVYFTGGTGTGYRTPYVVHGPSTPAEETMPTFSDGFLHNIFDVWGSSATDLYAVGNGYAIYHSTGDGTWTQQTGPSGGNTFEDVWGSGPNDIYLASQTGGVYHSAGDGTWSKITAIANGVSPVGVWGASAGDVYVVGRNQILHYKP